jgi:nucleoside-diphosphate-sugar epimerase
MRETWADITKAANTLGYRSKTRLSGGLRSFVQQTAA